MNWLNSDVWTQDTVSDAHRREELELKYMNVKPENIPL